MQDRHSITGAFSRNVRVLVLIAPMVWQAHLAADAVEAAQAGGLKIVVIEGEDAVNIIQQKTAVAPVVEVRDRNDQPVAGAVVQFAIRSGRATFNGARTLTVTTNAAGRAAVTALTPTGSGALQISASAAFQGQTAVATIAQTNVLTAAEAAGAAGGGAGGSGGSGGSAGGASGAGSSGGLSATTIGVIGGAAAAGTLVAVKATDDEAPTTQTFSGSFSGQRPGAKTFTLNGAVTNTCSSTRTLTGPLTMTLEQRSDGTVSGTLSGTLTDTAIATNCVVPDDPVTSEGSFEGPVSGTVGSLQFSRVNSGSRSANLGTINASNTFTFSGALSNGVVSGTLTITHTETLVTPVQAGAGYTGGGTATMPVTLR